jgi:hypothetical protein
MRNEGVNVSRWMAFRNEDVNVSRWIAFRQSPSRASRGESAACEGDGA